MNAFLNATLKIVAFGDKSFNSNPRLRLVDWNRDASGQLVSDVKSETFTIDPGATRLIFDGTRTTSVGSATAFAVTLSPLDPSQYRFTWTGGTNPSLRTDRSLTLNAIAVTITTQANSTALLSVPSLASFDFNGVAAGDTVLIPGTNTGDASSVFSPLNTGRWQVLAVLDSKNLSIVRLPGQDFVATTETVTLSSNTQLQAYSTSGVQVGDAVDISAGFAPGTRKTYSVVEVSSRYFEVISTTPLPPETAITPGASGLIFYTEAKSFVYLEVDQEACLRMNGSTDNSQRLSPIEAGNSERPGPYLKRGPCWSLSIVNRSPVTLNLFIIHCE